MIGKVYHNLAAALLSSKRRVGRTGRLVLLAGGLVMVSLAPADTGWFSACVSLGLMMQMMGFLCGRHPGWLVSVPAAGVLGWCFPSVLRLCDQIAIYELMLWGMLQVFARSLRQGQVPLVTRLAEAVHGSPLRSDVLRYTIGLTWAWSVFFILAMLAPFLLWLCAPHEGWWRIPLRGGTVLAAIICFIMEMLIRRLVIRNYDHSTLKQNVMAGRSVFMRKD